MGDFLGSIFGFIFFSLLICVSITIYFMPSIIAFKEKSMNIKFIFILNVLAGWTIIGWIISLLLAFKEL